jgi:hypothetical protein
MKYFKCEYTFYNLSFFDISKSTLTHPHDLLAVLNYYKAYRGIA